MRPRSNTEVNQYYLCDSGRLDYRWMNRTDRIEAPLVRRGDRLAAADWDEALRAAALHIHGKRAFVLASPMLSNESLWMLSRLVRHTGGAGGFRVARGPEAPLPGVPDLARRTELAANVIGAELLGFRKSDTPLDAMQDNDVLIIADHDLSPDDVEAMQRASAVIVIGTVLPDAARHAIVALPATNVVEEEGTFTNVRNRVQRYQQARTGAGMSRPVWSSVGDLLAFLGEQGGYLLASQVFADLAAQRPEYAEMSYDSLGFHGQIAAAATNGAAR
jgi:NADH-quinone oxidoreductase subunit G